MCSQRNSEQRCDVGQVNRPKRQYLDWIWDDVSWDRNKKSYQIVNQTLHHENFCYLCFQSGLVHDVFGMGLDDVVYRRIGVNITSPTGTGWESTDDYATHITTGLNGQYKLVKGDVFYLNEVCQNTNWFATCTSATVDFYLLLYVFSLSSTF